HRKPNHHKIGLALAGTLSLSFFLSLYDFSEYFTLDWMNEIDREGPIFIETEGRLKALPKHYGLSPRPCPKPQRSMAAWPDPHGPPLARIRTIGPKPEQSNACLDVLRLASTFPRTMAVPTILFRIRDVTQT
ncbi:hypothetical protein IGI04_022682, partial [Brassica rapa subsp. trilocularis]